MAAVMRMGRIRSRAAWTIAWRRRRPSRRTPSSTWSLRSRRSVLTWSMSTMPLFTTMPMRMSTPIHAMTEKLVPVARKNQKTPTMANKMEVQMAAG